MNDKFIMRTDTFKSNQQQTLNGTRVRREQVASIEFEHDFVDATEGVRTADALTVNNIITDGCNSIIIKSDEGVSVRFSDGVYDYTMTNVKYWVMSSDSLLRVAVHNPTVNDVTYEFATSSYTNDGRPVQFPEGAGDSTPIDVPVELGSFQLTVIDGVLNLQSDNTSDRVVFKMENGELVLATSAPLTEGSAFHINQDGYLVLTTP